MLYPDINNRKYEEIWTPINTELYLFNNIQNHYLISSYGRVYNQSTQRYIPQNMNYNKDKYINITLSTIDCHCKHIMLHRLIMYTFNYFSGCEDMDVNHIDGIKYHNWIWNLEWVTHKDNMLHAWNNNLFKFGEERKNTKLTTEQVKQICSMIDSGYPLSYIAHNFHVDNVNMKKTVYNIASGHCWSHISKDYNFYKANKEKSSTTNNNIIIPIRFN